MIDVAELRARWLLRHQRKDVLAFMEGARAIGERKATGVSDIMGSTSKITVEDSAWYDIFNALPPPTP